MPPIVRPDQREQVGITSAAGYVAGDRVWLYRVGWRPGVVASSSERAVCVRYRPNRGSGTAVDTALAADVAVREEPDPYLDRCDAVDKAAAPAGEPIMADAVADPACAAG